MFAGRCGEHGGGGVRCLQMVRNDCCFAVLAAPRCMQAGGSRSGFQEQCRYTDGGGRWRTQRPNAGHVCAFMGGRGQAPCSQSGPFHGLSTACARGFFLPPSSLHALGFPACIGTLCFPAAACTQQYAPKRIWLGSNGGHPFPSLNGRM